MNDTIFIVPYSHIDWGWGYYLGDSIKDICKVNSRIVLEALKILEEYPRYRWTGLDKVYTFFSFWIDYPELRDKLKSYIKDGRIDIACGMVSTPHLLGIASTYCGGESFIRNIIYGRRFLEKMLGFGFKNIVLQLNDVTGMFSQLPQIALKCGYRFLKFERPFKLYNELKFPMNFYWQSPDGSKILCNRTPYGSAWKPNRYKDFEESKKDFLEQVKKYINFSNHRYILFYQGGDWDPPYRELVKFVEEWNKRNLKPFLKISTPTEYFEAIKDENNFPTITGSLDNVSWAALYGVGGDRLRRRQRELVSLLLTCEKFCTIASLFGYKYPGKILEELWIREVLWEDHNSLGYLYLEDLENALNNFKYIEDRVQNLLYSALKHISDNIILSKKYKPIVVFNQLGWDRDDIVEVKIFFNPFNGYKFFKIIDRNGNEIPYQKIYIKYGLDGSIEEAKIIFRASVPSLGYNVYYVVPTMHEPKYSSNLKIFVKETCETIFYVLENNFYRIMIANGHIVSIFDKRFRRECLNIDNRRGVGIYFGNSILCEKVENKSLGLTGEVIGLLYSSSEFSPSRVEVIENGPIRAKIRIEFNYIENPVSIEIILYDNIPRIEFRTIIDAKKFGRRFRTIFPVSILNGELRVYKPFYLEKICIEKEIYDVGERSDGKMGKVFGAHNFIDYSDKDFGVTFISKQGSGFMLEKNIVSNILLITIDPECLRRFRKCPILPAIDRHEFEYALYFHGKDKVWKIYRIAEEYLNPLIYVTDVEGGGKLPESYSFLKIVRENIVLSSLFMDWRGIVMRMFEIEGAETPLKIQFFKKINKIFETDFLGKNIRENGEIRFKPHEIKDIGIKI